MTTSPPSPTASRVLVVDDDVELSSLVREVLVEHGHVVDECTNGRQALERIDSLAPDLVVLDLGLPGMGGLDVLRTIREAGGLPVIILSGRGDEADRVVGLELGADDYVVKPFSPRELAARVSSVLRRTNSSGAPVDQDQVLVFDRLAIDVRCRDVWIDDVPVELTAREFDLLAFLAASPRQVFTREQLLQQVWSSDAEWQDPRTIAEHVHRLRRKIEPDPSTPRWIQTLRGAGYRFTP